MNARWGEKKGKRTWIFVPEEKLFLFRLALVAATCSIILLAMHSLPRYLYLVLPPDIFLTLHSMLEIMSIVVSFAVFAAGWHGHRQTRSKQDLLVAYIFLIVGTLDLAHTLSYKGMPPFITPNTSSKAATYWLAARMSGSVMIFMAAFASPSPPRFWLRPTIALPLCVTFIVAVVTIVSLNPAWLPVMVDENGLTPIKIVLEWLVIVFYVCGIGVFALSRKWPQEAARLLQTALLFGIFSEIAFTQYHNVYDSFNLLGHIFKVVSYYYVWRALFVVSFYRPYQELLVAKNNLFELAMRNEELYKEAQKHLEEIQQSFSMVGAALASSLKLEETIDLIVRLACEILHSDHAAVGLRHENPETMKVLAQRGVEFPSEIPIERSAASEAFENLQPIVVDDLRRVPRFYREEHKSAGLRSMVIAPIVHQNDILGAISVYSPKVGVFGQREADILLSFAQQAAVAIKNAVAYQREHKIADTLQSSLMSHNVPDIDGFRISRIYMPASSESAVGGDFYDLFLLSDDKLAVVIGDVSGKGLTAAVHTAMTKHTVRAYALEDGEPSRVLSRLCDAMHVLTPDTMFITLCYGVLDIRARTLAYSSAGHEPPIIVRAGEADIINLQATGPALGIGICYEYSEGTVELGSGDVLLFFTDGLTEARRHGKLFGAEGIARVVREKLHLPPDQLSQEVVRSAAAFAGGELNDDIALLLIKVE